MSDQLQEFSKLGQEPSSSNITMKETGLIEDAGQGRKTLNKVSVINDSGNAREVGVMFLNDAEGHLSREELEKMKDKIQKLNEGFRQSLEKGEIDYIPLRPTIRFNGMKMLGTDMTEGGKKGILDLNTGFSLISRLRNLDKVKEEVIKISKISFDSGVVLGTDSYAIVIDQEGIGRAYILDYGNLKDVTKDHDLKYSIVQASEFNTVMEMIKENHKNDKS